MGVKKIILTRSSTLEAPDKLAGQSGKLLVVQDAVGGHLLELGEGYLGSSSIGLRPNAVTELTWIRDDVTVYWTSILLTAENPVSPPSRVTDLLTELVDTKGAKISWHAPQGFDGNNYIPSDIYFIIISPSSFDLAFPPEGTKIKLVPGMPGTKQSYVIAGLNSGQRYFAAIYSQKSAYGHIEESLVSNMVTFFTQELDSSATIPKRIPLFADKIYDPIMHIAWNDGERFSNYPAMQRLADQDYLIDNNGIPEGLPDNQRVAAYQSYGDYNFTWYNIPAYVVYFDLGGVFDLDYVYVLIQDKNKFNLSASVDAIHTYSLFNRAETPISTSNTVWTKIPLNENNKKGVRYLILELFYGDMIIQGIVPYGTRLTKYEISGIKHKRIDRNRTFNERIGTNAFFAELNPDYMGHVSSMMRSYNNWDWFWDKSFHPGGSAIGLTPDDLKLALLNSHMWDYRAKMQEFMSYGQKILFCLTNSPQCLRTADFVDSYSAKPLDPGLDLQDLANTTDPQSYKWMARMCAVLAAKLGFNTVLPESDLALIHVDNEDKSIGWGLVEYFEMGNENDGKFRGQNAYRNPEEQAAELSAYYDGHKGALGPFMGIKSGDPNAKLLMPGMASANYSYVWKMMRWWDLNRGVGDYPIDVMNFHHYNNYTHATDTPEYSTVPAWGLPPELGDQIQKIKEMSDLRDQQAQSMELWCTEMGFGEQYGGITSARDRTALARAIHKSAWLIRMQLICQSVNVDVECQYFYAEDTVRVEDLNPDVISREQFFTTGYLDGITSARDRNRKPLTAYWYMNAFRNDMIGYTYSHTVVKAGVLQIMEDNIILSFNPNLWIMAYTHSNGSKYLIAWMGTDQWVNADVEFRIPNSETTISVIAYTDQHVTKIENGLIINMLPAVKDVGKTINVNITEIPTIVKTSLVGTEKLIKPKNVLIQSISSTSIKLAWTDENYGINETIIYQSLYADRDFVVVNHAYHDNAEITISGLAEYTGYFFKIGFILGSRLSDLSDAIGALTLATVNAPTALVFQSATSSTITLGFYYSALDESKIDNFVIYRANSINGVYVQIGVVAKTLRTFRDIGLIPTTDYFYKIRSKKEAVLSDFSFVIATTTQEPSIIAPIVSSVELHESGTRFDLYFTEEVTGESSSLLAFTLIETFSDHSVFAHSLDYIILDESDRTKLTITMRLAAYKDSTLSLSYDNTLGALRSIYGVDVLSFNDVTLLNRIPTLFTRLKPEDLNNEGLNIQSNNLAAISNGGKAVINKVIKAGTNARVRMGLFDPTSIYLGVDVTPSSVGYNELPNLIAKYNGKIEIKIFPDFYYNQTVLFTKGQMEIQTEDGLIKFNVSLNNGLTWTTLQSTIQPDADLFVKFFAAAAGQKALNISYVGLNGAGNTEETPAPTWDANRIARTLTPSSEFGDTEIEIQTGLEDWLPYTGPVTVGNGVIAAGLYKARVRASSDRLQSPISQSPALAAVIEGETAFYPSLWIQLQGAEAMGATLAGLNNGNDIMGRSKVYFDREDNGYIKYRGNARFGLDNNGTVLQRDGYSFGVSHSSANTSLEVKVGNEYAGKVYISSNCYIRITLNSEQLIFSYSVDNEVTYVDFDTHPRIASRLYVKVGHDASESDKLEDIAFFGAQIDNQLR